MSTIAPGLNFRIGADVKGINKAIREAEKSLRSATQSFSSIGNSLSVALSAPIAGFVALSTKVAGQFESLKFALEGTMKDAGYSISQAKTELDKLREAALAPGLDFEQAVKGSVRLQSVGIAADKARKIVTELANALALSGGTADQLDGVTKQFTQMIGKGKILQEDISIILENMPNLAKVMKDQFGTATAEGLNKAGVSVDKFIEGLTVGMGKLARAQGGISNAITNAISSIQQTLASIGDDLNKTFNISGALENFAKGVASLGTWFGSLSDETKRAVGAIAVFLAALGPATLAMGKLAQVFGGTYKWLLELSAGFAKTGTVMGAFSAKWKAMDTVMRASVIGAIAAVVLAAAAAFVVLKKDMSAAAQAARAVDTVQKEAANSIAQERAEIELHTKIATDNNEEMEVRRASLDRLIQISPKYRKALKDEAIITEIVTDVTRDLLDTMIRTENARRAVAAIGEIDDKLRNLKETSDPSFWQTVGNAFSNIGNAAGFVSAQTQGFAANMEKNREALNKEREALQAFALEQLKASNEKKRGTDITNDDTNANDKAKTALEKYLDTVKKNTEAQKQWNEAREAMGLSDLKELPPIELPTITSDGLGVEALMSGFEGMDMALENVEEFTTGLGANFKIIQGQVVKTQTVWQNFVAGFTTSGGVLQQVADTIKGVFDNMATAGEGFKKLGEDIMASLKKLIGGMIKVGVAAVVQGALVQNALLGPFAVPIALAAGAIASTAFNSLISKLKVPGLAEGGVLTAPRLVMAGEYPGARSNPEIVTPENKMRDVVGEMLQRFGGGFGNGKLVAKVSGRDIYFMVEEERKYARRVL